MTGAEWVQIALQVPVLVLALVMARNHRDVIRQLADFGTRMDAWQAQVLALLGSALERSDPGVTVSVEDAESDSGGALGSRPDPPDADPTPKMLRRRHLRRFKPL